MTADALELSVLESKDKEQLLAIAKALGLKATTRTKKSDSIEPIREPTGAGPAPAAASVPAPAAPEPRGRAHRRVGVVRRGTARGRAGHPGSGRPAQPSVGRRGQYGRARRRR